MEKRIRIIVADDHPIVLEGLIKAIEAEEAFEIIAHSADGNETFELIKRHKPDIALLDISMPGKSGLDILKEIQHLGLNTRVVILTMYDDLEYFDTAMDLGAMGYLLKENAITEILHCLHTVYRGKHYICSEFVDALLKRNRCAPTSDMFQSLTPTECKILKLIAQNKTSRQISEALYISVRTVQNHRNNICQKLNLHGSNKLLQFALENKSTILNF
jgi:DNA-binding NarL/FixJ family response regulator